jgi:hypothetical protein
MAKSERILSFFPSFYGATEQYKLLHEVVRQLALHLEEADTHLFRIQRAHRIRVAEQAEDILRLAALLNLTPFHFEDLLASEALEYEQKLALMRERVQRVARVHLRGSGTPWAVLQGAAIFLDATIVPERPGDSPIKHLDGDGFSHKAVVEFTHLPDRPRERIYLHENPFRRQKVELAQRWSPALWTINSKSTGVSPVRLVIQGVGDRTVLPSIYCPETEVGLLFNGIVPDGKMLVIDEITGATIEGEPVDDWLIYSEGGAFGYGLMDRAHFVREQGEETTPFGGDLEAISARPYRQRKPVSVAPIGRSRWHFKVAEGVYDGGRYDFAVYATPSLPIGLYDRDFAFDESVFDYPASAVAGMAWDERIPCAFKLLLPANVPQLLKPPADEAEAGDGEPEPTAAAEQPNYVSRIGSVIPRFKAAGVRAYVGMAQDAWILGESVIRDADATGGEGITVHATCLCDPKADMLVAVDRSV